MKPLSLCQRDAAVIWHPFTQVGLGIPPLPVTSARGSTLTLEDGTELIDGISSWWCCIHGHGRAELIEAATRQFERLDHVLFAGCTHEPAVLLAEGLLEILPPGFSKIFYSDNGSTAIEVALKLSLQFWSNQRAPRTGIIALHNSYHGDTFGAMAAGARGIFSAPFENLLFDVHRVSTQANQCDLDYFEDLCRQGTIAAFIFEPRVQGAGGMLMYDTNALDRYMEVCRRYHVLTIADEVMTGFGRTGPLFASSMLRYSPDIICLSKALTSGTLPLAVTACSAKVFNAFISSDHSRTFFHGHTYTANPIACAVANASLSLLKSSACENARRSLEAANTECAQKLSELHTVANVRVAGTILAFDCPTPMNSGHISPISRSAGEFFRSRGILLRPLGSVVYCIPPYCLSPQETNVLHGALIEFAGSLACS